MVPNQKVNPLDVLRLEMITSLEKYTRAMFKAQYKRSFVVSKLHKQMFEALQDVVDGKCKRLIINMPPRYGKCMHPSTEVFTPKGLVKIGDLKANDEVYSFDNGKLVKQRCQGIEPAYKQSVKVTMRSGRSFICSTDHPMLTLYGYKEASKLKVGECIQALKPEVMTNPERSKYLYTDFYLSPIESIQDVGMQELVHVGVDNTHNFIANGLVSHNTEVAIKSFISYCFALNPTCRFLHLSYSDMLVNDNSNTIRQIMQEPLYASLFPKSALEKDKGSSNRWKTKAGGELYAVSTQGQVTGFGAGKVDDVDEDESTPLMLADEELNKLLGMVGATQNLFQGAILIDDPLKPEDALSDTVRERINQRFENTIRNRTNSRNTPIIIIMQRLHEHDLCGYLMEKEPDEWRVLSLPAIQVDDDGKESALWELKHTLPELRKMRILDPLVFDTQYLQDPTPKEGLLYSRGFKTYSYEQLPKTGHGVKRCNYTDTADTGADNLCSICFIDTPEYIYITDVLFTDKPMEATEPATAEMLNANKVQVSRIESNNGGRGFCRNVQRIIRTTFKNPRIVFVPFTQTANKYVRMFTRSAEVQNLVLMPEEWEHLWPKFHSALMSYRKDNKRRSQHDDAPDALTGVVEMHGQNTNKTKVRQRN